MPYSRSRYPRRTRRYGRKKFYKKPKGSSLASKAYKMAKSIKRSIETKINNVVWDESKSVLNGIQVYNISEIAEGTGPTQRIGNEVSLKSIYLNLTFTIPAQGNDAVYQCARIIIVQSLQQVPDTNADPTRLLRDTGNFFSNYNYPTYKRYFAILHDKVHQLGPYNGNGAPGTVISSYYGFFRPSFLRIRVIPRIKKIRFNGPTVNDEEKNNIFMFVQFISPVATQLNFQSQICFTDL